MAKHILIVEDERPLSEALEIKLSDAGFRVSLATDGKIALNKIQGLKVDLILLDLMMPVMDGFEMLKKMKEMNIDIPIIVLTNLGSDTDIKKIKKFGVKDYLVKSDFSITGIIDKINKYL